MEINNYCRICLTENFKFKHRIDENDILDIMECLSIKINLNNKLSKMLCNKCYKTLMSIKFLKETFTKTENYLKNKLNENNSENILDENYFENTELDQDDMLANKFQMDMYVKTEDTNVEKELVRNDIKLEVDDVVDIKPDLNKLENLHSKKKNSKKKLSKHKKKREKCTICNKNVVSYSKHIESHLHLNKLRAEQNNLVTKQLPEYRCEQCNYTYFFEYNLTLHLKNNHRDLLNEGKLDLLKCTFCDRTFKQKKFLGNHINYHKGIVKDRVVCYICGSEIVNQNLGKHLRDQHDVTSFKKHMCRICNEDAPRYDKKSELVEHLKVVHNTRKNTKGVKCPECGVLIGGHLKRHIDTVHLKIKPFQCEVCHRKFRYGSEFKVHVRVKHLNTNSLE